MTQGHAQEASLGDDGGVETLDHGPERAVRDFVVSVGGGLPDANVQVELWNGSTFETSPGNPVRFRLKLRRPDSLRRMFAWPVDRSIAESYFTGVYDLEGDFEEVFQVAAVLARSFSKRKLARVAAAYFRLPMRKGLDAKAAARNPKGATGSRTWRRSAVSSHYDVSDAFYARWLDARMVYSGAYYERDDESLEVAQERKLDHICRSLQLRGGQRLLDIGCGWGALAVHAAENYGAIVEGVTLSHRQAAFANERFREKGLENRCRVHLMDYRDVKEFGSFDAVASVEMLHHVRRADLLKYFSRVRDLLVPGGRSYQLTVTAAPGLKRPPRFARQYFMPDFFLTPFGDVIVEAERAGFDLLATRSLREQYRLTAREWVRRMESAHVELAQEAGEDVYRIWRLSLSLMAHAFGTSELRFHDMILRRRMPGIDASSLKTSSHTA